MQAIEDINPPAAQVAQVVVISADWAKPRVGAHAPAPAPARQETGTAPSPAAAPAIELADPRIRQAVAATLAEAPDRSSTPANQQEALRGPVFGADTPDQYKQFAKDFAYAKVPYCLGENGLKFQPPKIGPISLSGLLALPFLVAAKMQGKCK